MKRMSPGVTCRKCGTRLMVRDVCSVYCPNDQCGKLTITERIWCRRQPTFAYFVLSEIIYTKCGKRFATFKEYRDWVNLSELLEYAGE